MKLIVVLLAFVACLTVVSASGAKSSGSLSLTAEESKTQPKEVVLAKDSQSDKYGEVAFNHENHTTKMYDPAGTAVLPCTECHHTDQPATALKAPLKTSERNVVLTSDLLKTADAKPVRTCRTCHLQAGDDSAPLPVVTYEGKPSPTKLTNEVAYHNNCNICHDKALAARPTLKGKVPGSTDCVPCHKPAL